MSLATESTVGTVGTNPKSHRNGSLKLSPVRTKRRAMSGSLVSCPGSAEILVVQDSGYSMLSEIFTSESFWFWALVIVQSGLIVWFVESATPVAAGVTVGTLIVGISFFPTQWGDVGLGDLHDMSFPAWLSQNAWALLAGLGCYLFVGVAWATFRWWLLVRQMRESYERAKAEWLAPGNLRSTATMLRSHAEHCPEPTLREKYLLWSEACRMAAAEGGHQLTHELKPVWKDYVTNGSRL